MTKVRSLVCLSTLVVGSAAFSTRPSATIAPSPRLSPLSAVNNNDNEPNRIGVIATRTLTSAAVSFAILTSPLHNSINANVAHADTWGKETEAPTLFTGETVMICKKRGPLGACTETAIRTVENDNDKANKYFKDPSEEVKLKQSRMIQSADDSEGNALIAKLRKQSEDNKEKNDNIVYTRTLLNDQGASFGPFNSQVVILNTDGRSFTLLQNPQAMRLKKAGYIEDRKFVIQPSQQVIDEALESEGGLGDAIKGFFGGKGEEAVVEAAAPVEVKSEESAAAVVESSAVATEDPVDELDVVVSE